MIVRMMRMRVVGGGDCECSCGYWIPVSFPTCGIEILAPVWLSWKAAVSRSICFSGLRKNS